MLQYLIPRHTLVTRGKTSIGVERETEERVFTRSVLVGRRGDAVESGRSAWRKTTSRGHRAAQGLVMALSMGMAITSSASAGAGATVSIGASKDNTLYESTDGLLSNGAGASVFVGRTFDGLIRRGLLAFDVASAIPAGSIIVDAQLTLSMTRTRTGEVAISLNRVLADWGEGTSKASGEEGAGALATPGDATWRHRFSPLTFWQAPGGDFAAGATASQVVSGFGKYTWSSNAQMVSLVQSWLDGPSFNFGWALLGDENRPLTTKRFGSRNNTNPADRPVLSVTYIPSPSGAALLGIGVLMTSRRKRRMH